MRVSTVSSAEPDYEQFPYAGWIPSVNGRLSFRHIGESRHPCETLYANVTTEHKRYILGFQQRRLSDQFFQLITHWIFEVEDRFWFVICATTDGAPDRANQIQGTVHIYKSKVDWRTKANKSVGASIVSLNDSRLAIDDGRDQKIENTFAAAGRTLEITSDIELEFILWRTGEIYFSRPLFSDSDLEDGSIAYATKLKQDFPKWIADQAYFFIRDISHRHQHHASDSDTILILQDHEDDVEWRSNVLYSLHHFIIRAKRFADTRSLYQCIGVLAYANSFRATCSRFLQDRDDLIPPFNGDDLLQSLNARVGEQVQRTAEWGVAATLRLGKRAVGIAIFAVVVALLAVFLQPKIEKGEIPLLNSTGQFLGDHIVAIGWFLVTTFMVMWIFSTDWFIRRKLIRDVLEASNIQRKGAIYFLLSVVVVILLITYWVATLAVSDAARTLTDLLNL